MLFMVLRADPSFARGPVDIISLLGAACRISPSGSICGDMKLSLAIIVILATNGLWGLMRLSRF